ncbi:MAG: PKD domain-containing protein [Bacteroidales bacterium]|nr:PKD domain-containing protein [Bacteroidales bacterium]
MKDGRNRTILLCLSTVFLWIALGTDLRAQCPINPDFTYDQYCDSLKFYDASVLTGGGDIESWFWNFGDGGTSSNQNPLHEYGMSGDYNVTLTVTHTSGCDTSVVKTVMIHFPEAIFSMVKACPGLPTVFTDLSVPNATSITDWLWDFGDGNSSVQQNPAYAYSATGIYDVVLTVTNDLGCEDDTTEILLLGPLAGFYADTVCYGTSTQFTDTSSSLGDPIVAWDWDFGDGGTSSVKNPFHEFASPGIQSVKLVVTNNIGCLDSVVQDVRVDSLPVPLFTHTPACLGTEVCFFDESIPNSDSILNWIWTIDFSTTITGEDTICWLFTDPGDHAIWLTVINSNGCSATLMDTVYVAETPVASFTADEICFGNLTTFSNTTQTQGVETNWLWNFDDPPSGGANTSSLENPTHLFTGPGSFNVKLVAENIYGCADSVLNLVMVDSLPEASFSFPGVAVGVQVTFTDLSVPHGSPIITRYWDFGDGTTVTNPNPVVHTYQNTGDFDVLLAVCDANGCCDTLIQTVTVVGLPFADFSFSVELLTADFNDESQPILPTIPIVSWFWDFGISSLTTDTSTLQNPSFLYPLTGTYQVFLQITDINGGQDDTTMSVYVGEALFAVFDSDDVCFGDSTTFYDYSTGSALADIDHWEWNFGDGNTLTYVEHVPFVRHLYEEAGVYKAQLVIRSDQGSQVFTDTASSYVWVNRNPIVAFDSTGVCLGDPTFFVDQSDPNGTLITNWLWNFGDGSTSTQKDPVHYFTQLGVYNVTLKITNEHGCTDSTMQHSYVNLAPNPRFEYLDNCVSQPTYFFAYFDSLTTTVTEWKWYFMYPDTSAVSDEQNPVFYYPLVGSFEVILHASAYGCEQDTSDRIFIYPIPYSDFEIMPNYEGVQGKTFFENQSIYASDFFWDFGNGNYSEEMNPTEVYEEDSTYIITMIAYNEYGCTDTSMQELEVYFKGLHIPTAFSPNNPNSEVALFTPKGINLKEYHIQVYDLRSNLLWESEEIDEYGRPVESWDGYFEGRLMPQGTYIWKARAVFRDNTYWEGTNQQSEKYVTQGTVTLIR